MRGVLSAVSVWSNAMTKGAESNQSAWSGKEYAAEAHHHRSFDDWFLDRMSPESGDVVVDLGCGSGEFTARLAEILPQGRVIGVEPDPSMLKAARRHDHPRLEFVRASAEELEGVVDQGSVDKVLSRAMLHWLPVASYLGVFESIFRILRPGGWFHSESAGAGNVPQMVAVVDDLAVRFGVATPPRFPDTGVVFDMVEQAGFMIPEEGIRTVGQRRSFTREQAVGLLRTQGAVAVARMVDQSDRESVEDAAVAELERLRRYDGTFDQTFARLEILAQRPA